MHLAHNFLVSIVCLVQLADDPKNEIMICHFECAHVALWVLGMISCGNPSVSARQLQILSWPRSELLVRNQFASIEITSLSRPENLLTIYLSKCQRRYRLLLKSDTFSECILSLTCARSACSYKKLLIVSNIGQLKTYRKSYIRFSIDKC